MEETCQPNSQREATEDVAVAPTSEEVKANISQEGNRLIEWVLTCQSLTFFTFETQLAPKVLTLGGLFVQLFLCVRQEQFQTAHPQPQAGYKRIGPKSRLLGTFFGKVRYWRTYFYRKGEGYYPLDIELGLTGDGFSMLIQSLGTRIATRMSYAQTVGVLTIFLNWSPAQESIETMVLGLGRHTGAWFEAAPAPEGDGQVLVIQIDSKATPTRYRRRVGKATWPTAGEPTSRVSATSWSGRASTVRPQKAT